MREQGPLNSLKNRGLFRDHLRSGWARFISLFHNASDRARPKASIWSSLLQVKRVLQDSASAYTEELKGFKRLFNTLERDSAKTSWGSARQLLLAILLASFFINLLSLAFPLALLQIYDRIIPNAAINTLVFLMLGVASALVIETLLRITRSFVCNWADARMEHLLGCKVFRRLLNSSLLEFEREGSGTHVERLGALNLLRDFYTGQAVISLADIPFILILLLLIAYIAGHLVWVPIIMLLLFIASALWHGRKIRSVLAARKRQDERRFNFVIETIGKIHTIKSTTMEAQMLRRYERLQRSNAVKDYQVSLNTADGSSMAAMMSQATIILVVSLGSLLVIDGQLTIGGLAACTLLAGRCLQPINAAVNLWTRLQSISLARKDLESGLAARQESVEGAPALQNVKGNIEISNLSFRYEANGLDVIKNLNFSIKAKEAISITGAGLSGKTTLMWLLLGMFPPSSGTIKIDGQDILQCDARSIRRNVAYLPQQGVLFNGTILENLTMFDEKKYYDRSMSIVNEMGLATIIEHLPKGYHTPVATQAIEVLPKGIKQRITMARALIQEAPIIIFDDANIAVDIHGDELIKSMLQKWVGKSTLILVSHRPSILRIAERQYQLEGGCLRELT